MRIALAVASVLIAAPALAQPAPPPPGPAEPPVCTTVTTVVKKGDVVLSTNSTTRCERERAHGDAAGSVAGSVAGAAAAPLHEADSLIGSLFTGTDELKPRQVRGEWKSLGGDRVCHLNLMSEIASQGRRVKAEGCGRPLSAAVAWKLEDRSVALYRADGSLLVRLTGDGTRLNGDGVALVR